MSKQRTIREMIDGVLLGNQLLLPDEAKSLISFTIGNTVDMLSDEEWHLVLTETLSKYYKVRLIQEGKNHLAFCEAQE